MLNEIKKSLDKDYKKIIEILNKDELISLKKQIDNPNEFFDYDSNPFTCVRGLYEGYVDYVNKAYDFYFSHEKEMDKMKEVQYYALGLFVTFGVLTRKEFTSLMKKEYPDMTITYILDVLLSDYLFREIIFDKTYWFLSHLIHIYKPIMKTHGKEIRVRDSKKTIINRGRYLVDIDTKEYKALLKSEKISFLTRKMMKREAVLYSGFGNYLGFFEEYRGILKHYDDDKLDIINNYLHSLPSFMLPDKVCVSKEDADFYYATFIPFIKWYGKTIKMDITEYPNGAIEQEDVHAVIKKACEDRFKYVNLYLAKNTNLSSRARELLLGFKKAMFDNFIIYSYTTNGAILTDEKRAFLVKGLISPFQKMIPESDLPIFVETCLIPFEGVIISLGTYNAYPVKMGPGIRKRLKEKMKNIEVIESFVDA